MRNDHTRRSSHGIHPSWNIDGRTKLAADVTDDGYADAWRPPARRRSDPTMAAHLYSRVGVRAALYRRTRVVAGLEDGMAIEQPYQPFHDVHTMFDGDAARAVGPLARFTIAVNLVAGAMHQGLASRERRAQVEQVLQSSDSPAMPVILLGDLDVWSIHGRMLRRLVSHFHRIRSPWTCPTRYPLFALDRIRMHPGERLARMDVHRSSLGSVASDHYPLITELSLSP